MLHHLPCTPTAVLTPLEVARDPSAPSEHHFSSYVPLLAPSVPESAVGERAAPLDCMWEKMGHRWEHFSQEFCCLPELVADWSQGSKHFISEEKA